MRAARERPAGDPLPRWLAVAALIALAAWTFRDRWLFLTTTPLPVGVDGFWYPVQLRSLLAGHGLYYPAAPLTLWLMTPLAALTDPITGAKLGAALAAATLPIPVYLVARRATGERAGGLLAAALVATSAGSFYLATEFVKNAVALPIGVGALAAIGWALERLTWRRAALAAALVAATALAHPMVFVFVAFAAAFPLAARLIVGPSTRPAWLAVAGLGAVVIGTAAYFVARRWQLLEGLFTSEADWSLPALRLGERALHFRQEPVLAALAGVGALTILMLGRRLPWFRTPSSGIDRSLVIGPALWAIAIAIPWLDVGDEQGVVFRLRVIAFLPLALAAPMILAGALGGGSAVTRMTVLMITTGIALYRPMRYEAPIVRADADLAAAVAAATGRVPENGFIISPERHLVFMSTWYTGVETRLSPDSLPRWVGPERRWRLVPMAYMAPFGMLSQDLVRALDDARETPGVTPPIGLHRGNRNGLVLLEEATWQWVLTRLPPEERAYYQAWPVH